MQTTPFGEELYKQLSDKAETALHTIIADDNAWREPISVHETLMNVGNAITLKKLYTQKIAGIVVAMDNGIISPSYHKEMLKADKEPFLNIIDKLYLQVNPKRKFYILELYVLIDSWEYRVKETIEHTIIVWHHISKNDFGYGTEVQLTLPADYFALHTLDQFWEEVASKQDMRPAFSEHKKKKEIKNMKKKFPKRWFVIE